MARSRLPPVVRLTVHPTVIDGYSVQAHLGEGAFANTYRVSSPDGQEFALKWLKESPAAHGRERFQNEAWALGQLNHDSIPRLLTSGAHLDRPYIVMSLAHGITLRSILKTQQEERGVISLVRLLAIIEEALSAVAHMHSRGISHRDIKDDNIIVNASESQVTLVDLGMCTGAGQPVDAATFWNAGASRFAPPHKLRYPSSVHPTHDVFAVGVVAYLMLCNDYPWSVAEDGDRGALEDVMRRTKPIPIHQRNTLVTRQVSDALMALIAIQDDARPGPNDALATIRTARASASAALAPTALAHGTAIKFPRVVRDPVHGDIPMTEFEWQLMGAPEFQRLRWVRQLGTASLVFPGADHSRFSHALGTMFVADHILRRIEERTGSPFDPEERLMARAYALLHDVTHIAFGHTLEDELGLFKHHDANDPRIMRLILRDRSRVGELLRSTEYGKIVLAHFDSGSTIGRHSWLQELVSSPSGADVIDYISRDSLHCGLDHKVDTAIFRRFAIGEGDRADPERRHLRAQLYGRTGLRLDAEFALESILTERLGLFMKVYTHPAKIAAGAMIGKALIDAQRSKDRAFDEARIERMGDSELLYALRDSGRPLTRQLVDGVLQRQLYKPAFRSRALEPQNCNITQYEMRQSRLEKVGLFDIQKRAELEADIAKAANLKAAQVIVYCPREAPGLQKARQYVETKPGREELHDEVHAPYARMFAAHLRLWTAYVFVPSGVDPNERNAVAEAAESALGLNNELRFDRRQLVFRL